MSFALCVAVERHYLISSPKIWSYAKRDTRALRQLPLALPIPPDLIMASIKVLAGHFQRSTKRTGYSAGGGTLNAVPPEDTKKPSSAEMTYVAAVTH